MCFSCDISLVFLYLFLGKEGGGRGVGEGGIWSVIFKKVGQFYIGSTSMLPDL